MLSHHRCSYPDAGCAETHCVDAENKHGRVPHVPPVCCTAPPPWTPAAGLNHGAVVQSVLLCSRLVHLLPACPMPSTPLIYVSCVLPSCHHFPPHGVVVATTTPPSLLSSTHPLLAAFEVLLSRPPLLVNISPQTLKGGHALLCLVVLGWWWLSGKRTDTQQGKPL